MPMPENCFLSDTVRSDAITLVPVSQTGLDDWIASVQPHEAAWVKSLGFTGQSGTYAALQAGGGSIETILIGTGEQEPGPQSLTWLAASARNLPDGHYKFHDSLTPEAMYAAALGWCLELYRFDRYKKAAKHDVILCLADSELVANVRRVVTASALTRDLVNTPAEDMGPADLQDCAEQMAETFGAEITSICGDDLLENGFPAIHAVGRAATEGRAPRLIDLTWSGAEDGPSLTLVGKGVCFDTGGLNLKQSSGMRWMKKDMGGAAHALGLAQLIMASGLPIRLRVLLGAVENAVSGDSYRPGDVVNTRKGTTVEIGNTDAEGRVVLCDALTYASEAKPDLMIDFATLTGAARVALGPDLPATYTNDDDVWQHLEAAAKTTADPLWRMPLWAPYDDGLSSDIADMCNITNDGFAGSVTAALYLQRFVGDGIPWVHYDVFAWSPAARPTRPFGGEAQGIRATFEAIKRYFAL